MSGAGGGSSNWNDANTLRQSAYHLVNMSLGLETENNSVKVVKQLLEHRQI